MLLKLIGGLVVAFVLATGVYTLLVVLFNPKSKKESKENADESELRQRRE